MTQQEIKKAKKLLANHVERTEISTLDGGGFAITAHWSDGSGQKVFYALDRVVEHIRDHHPENSSTANTGAAQ